MPALRAVLLASVLALVPLVTWADPMPPLSVRCAEVGQFKDFDAQHAQEAATCEEAAPSFGRTLLAATYDERGVRKGVLVMDRGDLADAEGESADDARGRPHRITVHVFRRVRGVFRLEWWLAEPSVGDGPDDVVKLARLGPDKWALWSEVQVFDRGYYWTELRVWSLGEPGYLPLLLHLESSLGNGGNCRGGEDDPSCWQYDTVVDAVPGKGPWDLLRLHRTGSQRGEEEGEVVKVDEYSCLAWRAGGYTKVDVRQCGRRPGRRQGWTFPAGAPPAAPR